MSCLSEVNLIACGKTVAAVANPTALCCAGRDHRSNLLDVIVIGEPEIVPTPPLVDGTLIVNDVVLDHVRTKKLPFSTPGPSAPVLPVTPAIVTENPTPVVAGAAPTSVAELAATVTTDAPIPLS